MASIQIQNALISVFDKTGIDELLELLQQNNVKIYSTGGTQSFIESKGIPVIPVEQLTGYPSILGGRVKTLHPKVFGGILGRGDEMQDRQELAQFEIPTFDLVVVDLYPFEKTVASTQDQSAIIEKIDIGGVSLIRAAAKNHRYCTIVAHKDLYADFCERYKSGNGSLSKDDRSYLATRAFEVTAHYDTQIFRWFNREEKIDSFKYSFNQATPLRYGENPHQKGVFYGNLDEIFTQLNGKELSYNNLVDVEASIAVAAEFEQPVYVVVKHTNACGVGLDEQPVEAWKKALAADPVSAFGGVIATNREVDAETAAELDQLFFEVLSAPSFSAAALEILKKKKNRILLHLKHFTPGAYEFKSVLNGALVQSRDTALASLDSLDSVTQRQPDPQELRNLLMAEKIIKHIKSNAIVLVKDEQMIGMGCGQTSRVDSLKHALAKAAAFGFDTNGAVMASEAFFPFPDCVEIAHEHGITAVLQPGGSINDKLSIEFCDKNGLAMVFTGIRHFKH